MTCNECTFCNEDITVLSNLMTDVRARGNFRLANGLERALQGCLTLQTELTPANRAYLENIARIAKSDTWPVDAQTDLLRDGQNLVKMVKQDSEPQESGFTAMLTAARSSNPTSRHTEPTEPRSMSGFLRMLEESSKKTDEDAIQKALDEMEQDEAKHRQQSSEPTRRGMGFAAMLEGARSGTEGDEEPQPETRDRDSQPRLGFLRMLDTTYQQHVENGSVETRIPYGFVAMLESIWPHKPAETLAKRSYIRGMGFANMLKGAAEGTE